MNKSATQIAQETFERDQQESRLHRMHKTFFEKYAPDDPHEHIGRKTGEGGGIRTPDTRFWRPTLYP